MSPTIKDVAQYAGLSIATVSRALTGHPNVNMRTRTRVIEAARALGYQPDQIARSLRRRRSNLIGLVVSTIENVFFTQVARAAEQASHKSGYNLIVCNTEECAAQEQTYLSLLYRQLAAGVILAPVPGDGEHLRPFMEHQLPIVLINRHLGHLPLPSITCNDAEASRQCVQQLLAEGRRRIAAITGLPNVSTTEERLKGYRQALVEAGFAPDPSLEVPGGAKLEGGYQAMMALLQRDPRPDAVFVFNNLMTQGAVLAARDLQLRWPADIDIAGFGAFSAAYLYEPPLTLISQPAHTIGTQAVALLIAQIEGRAASQESLILPNQLIPRSAWLEQRQQRSVRNVPSMRLDGSS